MTKRTVDKKISKISFLEFSGENDENFVRQWKLDGSSCDDELFSQNKAEVLWSRDDAGFERGFFCDAFDSFSDATCRTTSSCSWHNDEFDMRSMNKVKLSLEAIEDALYERTQSDLISDEVYQECCDWAKRFPYLRLKGEQIYKSTEEDNELHPLENENLYFENSSYDLKVEGKKMLFHEQDRPLKDGVSESFENVSNFPEEIIDDDSDFEDYLEKDSKDICDNTLQSTIHLNECDVASSSIKVMQEKIIEKIALDMWPHVLSHLQKLSEKIRDPSDFQLPPIAVTKEQQKSFYMQRPRTEGMSLSGLEFPKLNDILSVSPKVLQKKDLSQGSSMKVARPTSEMSLLSRSRTLSHLSNSTSFKAANSILHQNAANNNQEKCKHASLRLAEIDRDSQNVCLYLPALEENSQDSTNILRGFTIQPERRETANKTHLLENISEVSSSHKHERFLPPIDDRDNFSANVKLTKNLFTFYGESDKKNEKRRCTKTPVSKNQPSASRKSARSYVEQKSIDEPKINSSCSSVLSNTKSSNMHEGKEDSPSDSNITLFPIVTSLVPCKEKNYISAKKGLLHAFIGRKR